MNVIELQATIIASIEALQASESTTKKELGNVSRDLLEYIITHGSSDVQAINRLLEVLTPCNKAMCIEFFTAFIPHVYSDTGFGGVYKGEKKVLKIRANAAAFLAENELNNVWTWQAQENTEQKEAKDLRADLVKAVKQALKGKDETATRKGSDALSPNDVLKAMIEGGINAADVLEMMGTLTPSTEATTEAVAVAH